MQYLLLIHANEAGWPKLSNAEQGKGIAAFRSAYAD
jgi:hypothetical protein